VYTYIYIRVRNPITWWASRVYATHAPVHILLLLFSFGQLKKNNRQSSFEVMPIGTCDVICALQPVEKMFCFFFSSGIIVLLLSQTCGCFHDALRFSFIAAPAHHAAALYYIYIYILRLYV